MEPTNDDTPLGLEIGVIEVRTTPGEWLVEAVDHGSEGEIYRAIFAGPAALERALEYAEMKYGHKDGVMSPPTYMHAPRPRPKLTLVPSPKE